MVRNDEEYLIFIFHKVIHSPSFQLKLMNLKIFHTCIYSKNFSVLRVYMYPPYLEELEKAEIAAKKLGWL
ncbi:MAG: hypothetical protein COT25_03530 [Candidatus Kerfeldbacteria bacterium CG08_land_8_20_14_0_20_42_7]|uniref:Uncharacterized protein n=1 Tax=Candidatus Kerfeldbacteria bacterium CG08_land_8_20_14_0_20_42_7 TaxID=2014245 RepID=A0A2H0YSE8_9BACT|nr:MAG: hypothetical protein COT25_03530 [Candidatus Kerfeldbacteria bacterium CG08_land_8_20_14_0_20_42_7]